MRSCPVCGNEIETSTRVCPWCETVINTKTYSKKKQEKFRCCNIKLDLPTTETALNRLKSSLHAAKADQARVVKIIHGYGSSGRGGDIRYAIREYLNSQKYSPIISYYVKGEEFGSGYPAGKKLIRQFPAFRHDSDWNKNNKGITLIVLP